MTEQEIFSIVESVVTYHSLNAHSSFVGIKASIRERDYYSELVKLPLGILIERLNYNLSRHIMLDYENPFDIAILIYRLAITDSLRNHIISKEKNLYWGTRLD